MKEFTTMNEFNIDHKLWLNCLEIGDSVKVVKYMFDLEKEGVVKILEIEKETPRKFKLNDGSSFWRSSGYMSQNIGKIDQYTIVVPKDYNINPYIKNALLISSLLRQTNFENLNNQQLQGLMMIIQGCDSTIDPLYNID
jgi:hypothetical protein